MSLLRRSASVLTAATILGTSGLAVAAPAQDPEVVFGAIAASVEASRPTPPAPPTIHIEVTRGRRPVTLRKRTSGSVGYAYGGMFVGETWETACVSPCDQPVVASNGEFRLGGPGVAPSKRFTIESDVAHVDLEVRPGRLGPLVTGIVLTGVGAGTVALSPFLFWLDNDNREFAEDYEDEYYTPNNPLRRAAVATAVVGSAALVGGIVLMIASRTRYKLRKTRR